jgi:hypothetical protein
LIKKIVFMNICAVLLIYAIIAEGADWLNLIQNEKGENQYIDIDSIEKASDHTFRVVRKTEFNDPSSPDYIVSHLELDCEKNRVKLLEETSYDKNGAAKTTKGNGQYKDVGPDDIDESLMELVCSLKKTR